MKNKVEPFETAVCTCKTVVKSQIPVKPKEGSDALVQGVNCTRCGALHIFATDSAHVETMFRHITLQQFYRFAAALARDGALDELNDGTPVTDDKEYCQHKTSETLYTTPDGRMRIDTCTWGCGQYIIHSANKNNIWSLVAIVDPTGGQDE